jgi:hypothetical protein
VKLDSQPERKENKVIIAVTCINMFRMWDMRPPKN